MTGWKQTGRDTKPKGLNINFKCKCELETNQALNNNERFVPGPQLREANICLTVIVGFLEWSLLSATFWSYSIGFPGIGILIRGCCCSGVERALASSRNRRPRLLVKNDNVDWPSPGGLRAVFHCGIALKKRCRLTAVGTPGKPRPDRWRPSPRFRGKVMWSAWTAHVVDLQKRKTTEMAPSMRAEWTITSYLTIFQTEGKKNEGSKISAQENDDGELMEYSGIFNKESNSVEHTKNITRHYIDMIKVSDLCRVGVRLFLKQTISWIKKKVFPWVFDVIFGFHRKGFCSSS